MNAITASWGLALLSLFVAADQAHASQCPSTNVVTDPVMFQWTHHPVSANNPEEYYSGTLEIGAITLDIGGGTLMTRAYRQEGGNYSIPGPTIVMQPGRKYVLRFKNTLPYQAMSVEHNVFKDPNVTNVHTHGLHISGETPADDVTRFFEGGFGGDYVYDIPADHMGGTFWYHAHHHGSTYLQVSTGAFGLMLIDDSQDGIPPHVSNMQEKHIVLGFLDPTVAGTGGDTLVSGTIGPTWTTNGTVNGNICMPPNTWQHWRVLVADRDSRLMDLEVGTQCEVKLLARDGVWRTRVPGPVAGNRLTLTGASRADLAVRCSADSSMTLGGTPVARVFVDGVSDASVHPYAADGVSTWASNRPAYLRDLRGQPVTDTETIRMGARSVLGSKFDADVPNLVKQANGIQEWNLNGANMHPFHLHVYHVQMVAACGPYEAGEYYDVVAGNCTVRFDLNPATSTVYDGRTIFHCHILEHEDQGAMGWMDVIGGQAPPAFPINSDIGTEYAAYYPVGGSGGITPPAAPGALAATAVSSSRIDLAWTDNAGDEAGFDIERSQDGLNFAPLASVGANVTAYADSGLTAATTYLYRVAARNANGSSAWSNTASAITPAAGTAVQVGSITVSTVSAGKGQRIGRAVVVVVDDQGSPVADATVSGEFSGDINQSVTGSMPTDAGGSTPIDSTQSAKTVKNLTFCVTGITHDSLQAFTAAPGAVCGAL
jgi:FtsP/CotA-like multicopper oxidase with cupredoxin domain